MWVFTKYGFYSVVVARRAVYRDQGDCIIKSVRPLPSQRFIRARVRKHLEKLQAVFAPLKAYPILEAAGTDYRYRMMVPKKVWAHAMQALTEEINYTNFKHAVHVHQGASGYEQSLKHIWGLLLDLQLEEEYAEVEE